MWKVNDDNKRKLNVSLNRAVRCSFGYNDWESVKDILFGFKLLPVHLYVDQAHMLLCSSCIMSEKVLVRLFAEHNRDKEFFLQLLLEHSAS